VTQIVKAASQQGTTTKDSLSDLAAYALERAKALGATAADVEVSTSIGQSVTVRLNEVETIEHNRDKGLGVTVYLGQQRGNASTTDFSRAAIERTVAAALAIAKYTAPDEFASLPDADRLAKPPFNSAGLYGSGCVRSRQAHQ
jgi:PmbA protein